MTGTIYTGSNFILDVGRESSFNSGESGGFDMGSLGAGLELSTFSIKNNYDPIYAVNQRTALGWYSKGVAVDFTADFYICSDNMNWLDFILTGAGGSSTTANTSWSSGLSVNSAYSQIQSYLNSYQMYSLSGIVFDSAKIAIKEGELVKVTLTGTATQETTSTPTSSISVTPPSEVLSWKDATVQIGSTLASIPTPIQSLDMTITTSKKQIYGLGAVTYQGYYLQEFKVEGTLTAYHDTGLIEGIFEQGLGTTDSAVSLSDNLSLVVGGYTFDINGLISNEGEMNVPPVKEVMDKISFMGTTMTVS
jgi:hypothetical protein